MTDEPQLADHVVSGIFRNRATWETQVWLDGRCVGACSLAIPREAQMQWMRQIVEGLTPAELVRVFNGRHTDGDGGDTDA